MSILSRCSAARLAFGMSGNDHDHEHEDHEHEHEHEHDDDARARARLRVALAQVRQYGDPVLRMKANEVETFDDELEGLAERMIALMHDADGIGLAATQMGVLRRMFVFSNEGEDTAVVNPVLTNASKETEVDEEGCLSLGSVRMPVERSVKVTLDARDVHGEPLHLELEGLPARVVQHETDHLDGTLIIDRTDRESRREAMAQLRPRLLLSR